MGLGRLIEESVASGFRCTRVVACAVLMPGSIAAASAQTVSGASAPGAAMSGLATPPGLAASAPQALSGDVLDVVRVVAQRVPGPDPGDSASAGVVTASDLAQRSLARPAEVLEAIPGMITTQHSGAGKANQYFFRGFNLDHGTDFETTLDGMPMNLRTHAHGQGYTDLNMIIPELVSRIDYLKGPYLASQGDFATAGSAAIRYVDRLDRDVLALTAGNQGFGRALFMGAPQLAEGRTVAALEVGHENGLWVVPENLRRINAVVRHTRAIEEGQVSIALMGYQAGWRATNQVPSRAIAQGLIDRFGSIDPTDGGQTHRYSLSIDLVRQWAGGTLRSTAYAIDSVLDLYSNFTGFMADRVNGDQVRQWDRRKVYGWNGHWSVPARSFGREAETIVGFDLREDRIDPVVLQPALGGSPFGVATRRDRVRETSMAGWVEQRVQWTGWLRSIAGLRLVSYAFDVDSNLAANSGRRTASMGLPKLSLVAGPWARTEIFLNGGQGFHSNDARGALARVDPATPNVPNSAAPVTPLVRGTGGELGIRGAWLPGWQSSISLWTLALASELVFDGDTGTTVPGRPSRREGLEWSNRYAAREWLALEFDLARTRARFTDHPLDNPGNRIPEALQSTAAAGASVGGFGAWSGGISMRYFGPRPLLEDGSMRSASTLTWNAQAGYRFDRSTRVRLDVFNLFNRHADEISYYYASQLRAEASPVNDILAHPMASRALRASLVKTF